MEAHPHAFGTKWKLVQAEPSIIGNRPTRNNSMAMREEFASSGLWLFPLAQGAAAAGDWHQSIGPMLFDPVRPEPAL